MSFGSFAAIVAVIVALAAIAYVWRALTGESTVEEDVRRVDMGTNGYAAQQAHAELTDAGLTTRIVTLEQGAFGIGMGEQYFVVYNAEDEGAVLAVTNRYLGDLEAPIGFEDEE